MKFKMRIVKAYIVVILLAVQVLSCTVQPTIFAEEIEHNTLTDDSLQEVQQKTIDIALSVGSSYLGLETFEEDLKNALEENGVDLGCVRIKTFDGVEISSESADAYNIFTTWTNFPFNASNYWRYDSTNKWITTSYNEAYETGYLDKTGGYIKDFTMSTNVQGPQPAQPLGFVFRAKPSEKYSGRWDLYYFWVSADNYGASEKVFAIFKVEGQNFDMSTRTNWRGTYSATPLMRFSKVYFGWPYHAPYDYGGYPNYTPYQTGVTVSNLADLTMKTKTIAIGSIPSISSSAWYDLSLNVSGNHYTASINDQVVLDVVDEDNPYTEGYYGIFSYSHVNPKFRNILVNQKKYKNLTETIASTEWREDSTKILIHLNDKEEDAFSTEEKMNEILEKIKGEGIFYVGWGNEVNIEQNKTFIKQNGGNGVVVDNGDYTKAITEIVEYVTKISRFPEGSGTKDNPYIIRTKEQLASVRYYSDAYFRFEEDIDYSGYLWKVLGTYDEPFTGHIDGNGHTVNHITISLEGSTSSPTGFIGVLCGGSVANLSCNHVTVLGGDYVGGIVGYGYGGCIIEKCVIEEGNVIGDNYVGGIVGYIEGSSVVDSSSTVSVYGKIHVGGIVGALSGAIIKDCMSIATVTGVQKVGGIIGSCINTRVENCLSFATLVGHTLVGGIAGLHRCDDSTLLAFQPIVIDCVSFATVKGEREVDGLIGFTEQTELQQCEDYATIEYGARGE